MGLLLILPSSECVCSVHSQALLLQGSPLSWIAELLPSHATTRRPAKCRGWVHIGEFSLLLTFLAQKEAMFPAVLLTGLKVQVSSFLCCVRCLRLWARPFFQLRQSFKHILFKPPCFRLERILSGREGKCNALLQTNQQGSYQSIFLREPRVPEGVTVADLANPRSLLSNLEEKHNVGQQKNHPVP